MAMCRLLISVTARGWPLAIVISGGCHVPLGTPPVIVVQVAPEPGTYVNVVPLNVPHIKPHMGTLCPPGSVVVVGSAVRVTVLCASAEALASRRSDAASPDLIRLALGFLILIIFLPP
jgi:hypothetical protein